MMLLKYKKLRETLYDHWERLFLLSLACVYLLYMFSPAQLPFWGYGHAICNRLSILIILSYFIFRGLRDGIELRLMAAFCLWLLVSRFINAGSGGLKDIWLVRENLLCAMFIPVAMLGTRQFREKLLSLFALITGIYCSVLACIGLYSVIFQTAIPCPWSDSMMLAEFYGNVGRLSLFGKNPNTCGFWFFIGFFSLVYLFFRSRKVIRIPLALGALLNYAALTVTYNRNSMLAFSLCFALLMTQPALSLLRGSKPVKKAVIAGVVVCVFLPASYLSFNLCSDALAAVSERAVLKEAEVYTDDEYAAPQLAKQSAPYYATQLSHRPYHSEKSLAETGKPTFDDQRGLRDTGRIPIYKSGIYTLKKDPARLICGCAFDNKMDIAHTRLSKPYDSFHSSYLQLLVVTGIPGLLIAFAFIIIVALKAARLFFAENPDVDMSVKALIFPVLGCLSYSLLESALFFDIGIRSLPFYLFCGALITYHDEVFGK